MSLLQLQLTYFLIVLQASDERSNNESMHVTCLAGVCCKREVW